MQYVRHLLLTTLGILFLVGVSIKALFVLFKPVVWQLCNLLSPDNGKATTASPASHKKEIETQEHMDTKPYEPSSKLRDDQHEGKILC